jgi:glucose/mannose transport system substrate-binding protein
MVGSKEAQEAFNKLKGSIPARTDVDRSKFDAYHQWSMDSFGKDKLVASCFLAKLLRQPFNRHSTMR